MKKSTAQEQAKRIVAQAQAQAKQIVAQAQKQAALLRARELERRARNKIRAQQITEQARVVRDNTVRLFRINTPNTLTLLNGVSGFLSIVASIQHKFFLAAVLILCGVFFDWLDGKAARFFAQESLLGKELDSLSDLVSFGVAPAVLVAVIHPSLFSYGAGALFVFSAALRLGRFNIQETKGVFFGVPTTTNGILLPVLIFAGAPAAWFAWYLLVMALLMNAPIKIKKVF